MLLRQAHRLTSDLLLYSINGGQTGPVGDILALLIHVAIVQANLGYIDNDPELRERWGDLDNAPPDEACHPVSALAVAASLNLPRETVRRKIRAQIDAGFCAVRGGGVYAPFVVRDRPENRVIIDRIGRKLADVLRSLARLDIGGLKLPEAGGEVLLRKPRRIIRVVSDFNLRTAANLSAMFDGDLVTALVFMGLARISNRHLPLDLLADEPGFLDDSRRVAANAAEVARGIGLPRETVRRRLTILTETGWAVVADHGYIVPAAALGRPQAVNLLEVNLANVQWLIARLRRTGLLVPASPDLAAEAVYRTG